MRQGEDRRRSRMPFVIVSAVWPWHFLVIDFEHGRLDVGFSLSPLAIRQRAQSNWGRIRLGSIVSQYFTLTVGPLWFCSGRKCERIPNTLTESRAKLAHQG